VLSLVSPEVISAIKHNFGLACGDKGKWGVMGHTWGTDPSGLLHALGDKPRQFDVLLLADTLWVTEAHSVLLDSIFALLAPGGIAHIAAGLHTGRGPVERFRTAAKERGGELSDVKSVKWMTGGGWEEHTLPDKGLEEERGVVIYFTLCRSI
jgi:nicotinamide N-methyltransferase